MTAAHVNDGGAALKERDPGMFDGCCILLPSTV